MRRVLVMSVLALSACHQNLTMSDQKKLSEWERSNVFRNGRVLQYAAPGSVSREQDTADVLTEKPPMTLALVRRGRERFNVFCSECHGYTGDADGMVVQRGFPKIGDEAFPGHQNFNNQIAKFINEGGKVYACRFALQALYGHGEPSLIEGIRPINPLDVLDLVLIHRRDNAFILDTWTL